MGFDQNDHIIRSKSTLPGCNTPDRDPSLTISLCKKDPLLFQKGGLFFIPGHKADIQRRILRQESPVQTPHGPGSENTDFLSGIFCHLETPGKNFLTTA
jgi:hypothetical protein